jgi:hypothetical protein
MIVEEFTLTLKYQVSINSDTGEMTTKCISRTIDKPKTKKNNEDENPQLILEDNKYKLNSAAIDLMGLSPDDKVDIKYEKRGSNMVPIIGTDEAFGTKGGNRLTKSNTVACRGSKNDELSKYGSIFTITTHESKENLFVLHGDSQPEEISKGDENISIEDLDEELPVDLSSLDLEEDINSSDFSFNL